MNFSHYYLYPEYSNCRDHYKNAERFNNFTSNLVPNTLVKQNILKVFQPLQLCLVTMIWAEPG